MFMHTKHVRGWRVLILYEDVLTLQDVLNLHDEVPKLTTMYQKYTIMYQSETVNKMRDMPV